MTDFLNQQIFPPANWQDFENLCADLWTKIWNDSFTQNNGRAGQPQHGVDVFGRIDGQGDYCGVQCKGRDGRFGAAVTEKELREEAKKLRSLNLP